MHSDTRVSIEINRVHFSDLWRCCCCCCFCFCLTCTGRANTLHPPPPNHHRTTTTNHQPPLLHLCAIVLLGARHFVNAHTPRERANRPTNLENDTKNRARRCDRPILHPPPSGVCVCCVADIPPLLHPFRAPRRWPLGTGYVFTITNSMHPTPPAPPQPPTTHCATRDGKTRSLLTTPTFVFFLFLVFTYGDI